MERLYHDNLQVCNVVEHSKCLFMMSLQLNKVVIQLEKKDKYITTAEGKYTYRSQNFSLDRFLSIHLFFQTS